MGINTDHRQWISEQLDEDMKFHDIIISADGLWPSVLVLIEDQSTNMVGHILRLYRLKEEKDDFVIDEEIAAFSFPTHKMAVKFANDLVSMSAFELLMIMNDNALKSQYQ